MRRTRLRVEPHFCGDMTNRRMALPLSLIPGISRVSSRKNRKSATPQDSRHELEQEVRGDEGEDCAEGEDRAEDRGEDRAEDRGEERAEDRAEYRGQDRAEERGEDRGEERGEGGEESATDEDVVVYHEWTTQMSLKELKDACTARKLSVAGKKKDLVQRLNE